MRQASINLNKFFLSPPWKSIKGICHLFFLCWFWIICELQLCLPSIELIWCNDIKNERHGTESIEQKCWPFLVIIFVLRIHSRRYRKKGCWAFLLAIYFQALLLIRIYLFSPELKCKLSLNRLWDIFKISGLGKIIFLKSLGNII